MLLENNLISLVMACRNEVQYVRAVVESLLAQETVPGRMTEILVADGMSNDGTRAVLDQLAAANQRIRVLDNPSGIVSTGLNTVISAARGAVVLRIDAHTEYAPDYVRRCVEVLEVSGADNVGGPARTRSEGWMPRAIASAYHSRFACGGALFHDENYEGYVDTVPYGCWRRGTLLGLGGFDERLVRNQDDELNLRLVRSGGKIWQSTSIVSWYHPRAQLGSLFHQYFQYGYWKVAVIRKHRLPASWRHLVPAAFVGANVGLFATFVIASLLQVPAVAFMAAGLLGLFSGLYLLANLTASTITAARNGWHLFPALPLVFSVYHVSYGSGFLLCSLHCILWPSRIVKPGSFATKLTRSHSSNAS